MQCIRTVFLEWIRALQHSQRINPIRALCCTHPFLSLAPFLPTAFLFLFLQAQHCAAFWPAQPLPNVDARTEKRGPTASSAQGTQHTALQKLQAQLPTVRADFDPIRRSPVYVRCLDGCLTGPGGAGKTVQLQTLDALGADTPVRPLSAFLAEHQDLYGHGPEILEGRTPARDHRSPANGVRTLVYEQKAAGIPVFESVLVAHLTRTEELLSVASTWMPERVEGQTWVQPLPDVPPVTATAAILIAAQSIGETVEAGSILPVDAAASGLERRQRFRSVSLPGMIQVRWVWLPMERGVARLSWCVELTRRQNNERYQVLVDARTADLLIRRCLSLYLQNASYLVYTNDSPTPFSPSFCIPTNAQPAEVARSWVTLAAANTNASPLGWIADGENETRGNNVDAALDRNADDFPDLPRPQGSPFRTFGPPLDLNRPAEESGDAAVVQLFYWCNHMHDRLYELGFTESAGNFQKDNLGRGGLGGDPILADAQDGSGVNNANFTPSADGEPGRIQMFTFDGPDPSRDGDLDAEIILHEYTHGLSTRLVGGGVGITTLQAGGMGEGWSDFYAMAMLSEPGDDPDACYAMGGYVTRQFFGLEENYYYGIRRYPYSTDLQKNPLTFKDIDPSQISAHPDVPRSPIFPFSPSLANEVHNQGEVWCVMLWEARSLLIRKYGYATGNRLILQLVTDGMKLSPPNPNFVQARDAILQADVVLNRGANLGELWTAFAKRGLGFSAKSPPSTTTAGIQEAFDLPDALRIERAPGFIFSGPVGGPYSPACNTLLLTNTTRTPLNWAIQTEAAWIELSPNQGTLAASASIEITLCVSSNAVNLPRGRELKVLQIQNLTSGVTQERSLEIRSLPFTQLPFSDDFEGSELRPEWFVSHAEHGRIEISTVGSPYQGKQHLILDSGVEGLPNRNELTLGLDLRGWTNVVLQFAAREFQDEPNPPPPSPFQDGADFDGVAISVNGVDWYEVQGLRDLTLTNRLFNVPLNTVIQQFGLSYSQYFQIRFNQFDNYPIPLDGIAIDDVRIDGLPVGRFSIVLPDSIREGDPSPAEGSIQLAVPTTRDVSFLLQSASPDSVVVSLLAVVRAGETHATFLVRAPDNDALEGSRTITITATAPGYFGEPSLQTVHDNETARITLTTPEQVGENAGLLAGAGRVSLDRPATRNLFIPLRASAAKRLKLPSAVMIPAGSSEAPFDITILNRQEIEGPFRIQVSAEVDGWLNGTNTMIIVDDDEPRLTLKLLNATSEGNPIIEGVVELGGTVSTNVLVQFVSSLPERLWVTNQILVASNRSAATFELQAIDDTQVQGTQNAQITATAPGFDSGIGTIALLDDETPPNLYQPTPADGATNQPPTLVLKWRPGIGEIMVNGDFEAGNLDGWTVQAESVLSWRVNDGNVNPDGPGSPSPPYEGDFSAILAQDGDGRHFMWQDVFIPGDATTATLTWVDSIQNYGPEFFTPAQEYRVLIRDLSGELLATAFQTASGDPLNTDWTEHSFDLTPFRGQTVRIAFEEEDTLGFINVSLDNVSVILGSSGITEFEVRFGTSPNPDQLTVLGRTEQPEWPVANLDPLKTYYWQVRSIRDSAVVTGPIWQWSTRSVGELHHFTWSTPSIIETGKAFEAQLSARDEFGFIITNYSSTVSLSAISGSPSAKRLLITEVDPGRDDQAEFTNVSGMPLDLSGWQISFYDLTQYPRPRTRWIAPTNTFIPPGGIFTLRESGKAPGTYPDFRIGTAIDWGFLTAGVPVAVLVQDAGGAPVDFFCAVDADPTRIREPITLPVGVWIGAPLPAITREPLTWQRIGTQDRNRRDDWVLADRNLQQLNPGLTLPIQPIPPLELSPKQAATFTNGVWTGSMTVEGDPTLLTLRAISDTQLGGISNPLQLITSNDLALTITEAPNTPGVDEPFQIIWSVTNTSSTTFTETQWQLSAPSNAFLIRLESARGQTSLQNQTARCTIPNFGPGEVVAIQLTAVSSNAGPLQFQASIDSVPTDSRPSNNEAIASMDVLLPTLLVQDASVSEGNSGTNFATVRVRLSAPFRRTVTADYTTVAGGATPGLDYQTTAGTLSFPPGSTNQIIRIPVYGDIIYEIQERFTLQITNATNAVIGDGESRITIVDDESAPRLRVGNVELVEGSDPARPKIAAVPVELSSPNSEPVSVTYFTADDTARDVSDYTSRRGILIFSPGITQQLVRIPIVGDRRTEPTETFFLILTNASNLPIEQEKGIITVRDDDSDQLAKLSWDAIGLTQRVATPFRVRVTARDSQGAAAATFEGTADLKGKVAERLAGPAGVSNLWEFPLRTYFHDARTEALYPASELGEAGRITSVLLNVAELPGQTLTGWTLRMRHERAAERTSPTWSMEPWTTVYSQDTLLVDPGWTEFHLSTPFDYNGTNSVVLDFSFDNTFYTHDGMVYAIATTEPRSVFFESDSAFGNPQDWRGATPPPAITNWVPDVRFRVETPVTVQPAQIGPFTQGVWEGYVTVLNSASDVRLEATLPSGIEGTSQPFQVITDPDPSQPPTIQSIRFQAVDVIIEFKGQNDRRYQLEATDRLPAGTWAPVGRQIQGAATTLVITEPGGALQRMRYYRVRELP